ncbi:SDR family NAD(P)-dependent oxidoreductase [Streptomyces sp. NPDC048636]|uniref:SDR family NAD(P)-dependent oxidoreductase n=1 Tax=Streptomyces sp. NPDC048636 TaxID=3155762 RepID=UPI003422935F
MNDDKLRDYLKRTAADLHRVKQRLAEAEEKDREPLAVVAMSCRYPGGVRTPEELWRLVVSGTDAITAFPGDRGWDLAALHDPAGERPGTTYAAEGGFLADAASFDPAFFGISPREALAMDPQQRLLLETTWEALERAGIDPHTLRGSRTGVFAGVMYQDYAVRLGEVPDDIQGYLGNGSSDSVASGRIAYTFGFEGPAVSVDTACSSSLVALHLACQALRQGDCALALAGGAMVMSTPVPFVEMSRQNGLASDGRCKSFSAGADGTGWGEGVGMLLLERLSDARRNGHPVLALVRGSAVNQDGASSRLTAPHGPSQQRVIRQALAGARLSAGEVDVVEAHGTGTPLGDPIEAQALLATYGREHSAERPLLLGSLKSNIGHTQAAAGVGGVIKMVLAMRYGTVPPTLHAQHPTPQVDWSSGALLLVTEATPWPETGRPRRAAVSSFGVSGTNGHVILEQAEPVGEPLSEAPSVRDRGPLLWVVSGRSGDALRARAAGLRSHLERHPELDPVDIGHSLATTRAAHEYRAALVADDPHTLLDQLGALAEGTGQPPPGPARPGEATAFVFPGQGGQWAGMAGELLDRSPVFAERMTTCAEALAPHTDWSLPDVIRGVPGAPGLDRADVVQPALFAVMVSLAALWRSYGVEPDAVVGHSQGEIAAACVAGALTLDDAATVMALRAKALRALAGHGRMASVALPEDRVRERIAPWGGALAVAAVNGPASVTVSGDPTAVGELLAALDADGVRTRTIPVDYASHGPQVEAIREELLTALADITPRPAEIPFYSTVTGGPLGTATLDAAYWYENLRSTVRFEEATRGLLADGHRVLLEVSPHPVLTAAVEDTIDAVGVDALATGTLRRDDGGPRRFMESLAQAHIRGVAVDWDAVFGEPRPRRIALPTYPFQRQRYWLENTGAPHDPASIGLLPSHHPLLGAVVTLADSEGLLFTGRLSLSTHPWLADHTVHGSALLPATAFLELAVLAAGRTGCARVEDLTLETPLVLPPLGAVALRLSAGPPHADGTRPLTLHSRPDDPDADGEWTRHATGLLTPAPPDPDPAADLTAWPPPGATPVTLDGMYHRYADGGFRYGPAFQGLSAVWRLGDTLYAEAALPAEQRVDAGRFALHPALLDAALHATGLTAEAADTDGGRMPFAWAGATVHTPGATAVRVRLTPTGPDTLALDAADTTGRPVASIASLTLRPAPATGAVAPRGHHDSLFQVVWTPTDCPPIPADAVWAVLGPHDVPLSTALTSAGATVGATAPRYRDISALAAALDTGAPVPTLAVLPFAPDPDSAPDDPHQAHTAVHRALCTLQTWLDDERLANIGLVLATRGAVAAATGEDPAPALGAVWGLVRSAQSEHPGRFTLVDLDPDGTDTTALAAALGSGEHQLAVRGDTVRVPRLARVPATGRAPVALNPSGTVLITGGTGLLGSYLAHDLVTRHGARHLLLVSRSGPAAPGSTALTDELTALGATVTVAACDTADRSALAALLHDIPAEHPLTAVVHTAGALDDGVLTSLTPEHLDTVLRPKADAALHLHQLTQDADLSAFVLFSSAAGTFGGPGQGNYAAANAFLDTLAQHRHARGLPAQSLAWTMWEQRSTLTGHLDDADVRRLARSGMPPLTTAQGLALFEAALTVDAPALVPMRLDIRALRTRTADSPVPPLLRGLVPAPRRQTTEVVSAPAGQPPLAERLAGLTEAERLRTLVRLVCGQVAGVLGHGPDDTVEPHRAFRDLGFDSLASVELRNRLTGATGLRLPATLVFDHPSPEALASHLRDRLTTVGAAAATTPRAPAPVDTAEPIAIVAMGCRFPGGVRAPEDLWRLLASGTDAIGAFPTDRGWDLDAFSALDPTRAANSPVQVGGFLSGAGDFDPDFFGISPREAIAMDPQQRLLLEITWETLERAGIDPASLRGTAAGVFIGLMQQDYAVRLLPHIPDDVEGFLGTGNSGSVVSGRIAYTFGFEGPALTIDTACSSSLVALHTAVQSLRRGECALALAGGVTVMSSPELFVEFGRQGGLAADGRCKSFAAAADGTGFGEGAGVLLLERLSDARRQGHPVLAVVRGSAVNQDGASNGLTAPNGPSQERVIRAALTDAGLAARDVDAVEAHGTGTTLGDPIEAQALLATYGQRRAEDRPLWLGSLKSNIGHTSAAAGVGGVMKMVLAMRHGVLPRTLHVDRPTPEVDWSAGHVRLLAEARPWEASAGPRRAGVSSFGVSGTNAHVILEQPVAPPAMARPAGDDRTPVPWPMSARTPEALRVQATRLLALRAEDIRTDDIGLSLATTRSRLDHRAVVVGDREGVFGGVAALSGGMPSPVVVSGSGVVSGGTVFVFPGQGSQWAGMAAELLDQSPVFAARMAECEAALAPYVEWSWDEVMRSGPGLDRVDVVQPVLFAVMVSLAAVWRSFGVVADAVVGHSQGEIAAAVVAGGLTLDDGARVVALRSRALGELTGHGGMVSLACSATTADEYVERWGGRLSVAAVNGPFSVVVSGEGEALEELLRFCEEKDVRSRRIQVDYASHCAQVERIEEELRSALGGISPRSGEVPLFSTVTGGWLDTSLMDGGYWYTNLRDMVGFESAVRLLVGEGFGAFIEVSPHPVLTAAVEETVEAAGAEAVVTGTLRRGEGGSQRMLLSAGEAYVRGVAVDWAPAFEGTGATRVDLPTYPFQERRLWLDVPTTSWDVASAGLATTGHPLLGAAVEIADTGEILISGRLSLRTHPWLAEHTVQSATLLPGTAFLELALRAAAEADCATVGELTLAAPLVLPAEGAVRVQVRLAAADDNGSRALSLYSRPERDDAAGGTGHLWTRHATGTAVPTARQPGPALITWPPAGAQPVDTDDLYGRFAAAGYSYGPTFQGIRDVWRADGDVLADLVLDEGQHADVAGYLVHPALLDAALQTAALLPDRDGTARLPFSWTDVTVHATGATAVRARLTADGPDAIALTVYDLAGQEVLSAGSLVLRPVTADLPRPVGSGRDGLHRLEWTPAPVTTPTATRWGRLGDSLRDALPEAVSRPELGALRAESGPEVPALVVVDCPRPERDPHTDPEETAAALLATTTGCLTLVREWLDDERCAGSTLVLVTRGALHTGPGDTMPHDVTQSGAWGLLRTARTEHPGRFAVVDLDDRPGSPAALVSALPALLAAGEDQVAVRDGEVLLPRLADTPHRDCLTPPEDTAAWRIGPGAAGTEGGLVAAPAPDTLAPLGAGEVRVAVRAAGLNFHDVVVSLGLDPDQPVLGSEGAGTVLEIGPGVADLVPGDRVMGVFGGAFGPTAVCDRRTLAPIPAGWTFAQAASVPIAFLTAWYGLFDLGGLRAGQSVLVHAATGGVGMAAVQLARHAGAEVYGTASPAKWDVLRGCGLDDAHIASTRTTEFATAFLDTTGGKGVDVVLDCLAREFVDASLSLLPRGGRFVEMGKTDVRDPEEVERAHPGVHYRAFDLMEAGPKRIGAMLTEILALFERGVLTLAPVTCWDVRQAPQAFRHLRRASHIGKNVLTLPAPLDPDGTVLITGGTGTLGALVARHLATAHGVRRLLLAGRRGPDTPGAADLVRDLAAAGARATVVACDLADPAAAADLLARVDREHPLTAVVHTAGVLDDGVLSSLTPEHIATTLRPKADAAFTLHELTRGSDLAAFVLFSSGAALLGAPGQGNYAAANATLDALAAQRRAEGLPAVSIGWGMWEERSTLTAHLTEADLRAMASRGIGALPTGSALTLFDAALRAETPYVLAAAVDPGALTAVASAGEELPAMLRGLTRPVRRAAATTVPTAPSPSLSGRLAGLPPHEVHRVLLDLVRGNAAAVLGHTSTDLIGATRPFKELGFDSLTGVELRNRLAAMTGERLPAALVFDHPTPEALAGYLATRVSAGQAETAPLAFAELDRLDTLVTEVSRADHTGAPLRAELARRLRGALTRLESAEDPTTTPDGPDSDDAIASATNEEIFDLIDKELGIS